MYCYGVATFVREHANLIMIVAWVIRRTRHCKPQIKNIVGNDPGESVPGIHFQC